MLYRVRVQRTRVYVTASRRDHRQCRSCRGVRLQVRGRKSLSYFSLTVKGFTLRWLPRGPSPGRLCRKAGVERLESLLGKSGCLRQPPSWGTTAPGWGGARDLREAGAGGGGPCASGQTQPVSVTTFSSGLDAHLPQEKVAEMLLTARVVQAVACGAGTGCGSTGPSRNSPEGARARSGLRTIGGGRIVPRRGRSVRPPTSPRPSQRSPPSPEPQRGPSRRRCAREPRLPSFQAGSGRASLPLGNACCK